MKVHQILEVGRGRNRPRVEPRLNVPGGSATTTPVSSTTPGSGKPLTGSAIKHNGVNYQWKGAQWVVTDNSEWKKDNPRSRRFKVGSIAPRDTASILNQKYNAVNTMSGRSNTTTSTKPSGSPDLRATPNNRTSAPLNPDADGSRTPDADADGKKPMGKFRKIVNGSVIGLLVGGGLVGVEIYDKFDDYGKVLEQHNGDFNNPQVEKKRTILMDTISRSIVSLLSGVASGAVAASMFSRIALFIPGFGWLVTLVVGGVGTLAAWVLQTVASDTGTIEAISKHLMKTLDRQFVAALATNENHVFEEAESSDPKDAMKKLIKSDPRMMKALKLAQQKNRAR